MELQQTKNKVIAGECMRKLQFCEASLNNLGQPSRCKYVEISGIPETEDENTEEIATNVGSLIGIHITESDLSVSDRLPKQSYRDVVRKRTQASSNSRLRAPNIVVKFVRRELRDRFNKARKFLRDKTTEDLDLGLHSGNKIYISENLTQINKDLSLTFLNFKIILSFKLSFSCTNLILATYQRSLIRFLLKHLVNIM